MPAKLFLLAMFLAATLPLAWADDYPRAIVTEADYPSFIQLRYAEELAACRIKLAKNDRALVQNAEFELEKAYFDTRWTTARYRETALALNAVWQSLRDIQMGNEDEILWAKDTLDHLSPLTIATAKAHLAELQDLAGLRQRALAQAQSEIMSPSKP